MLLKNALIRLLKEANSQILNVVQDACTKSLAEIANQESNPMKVSSTPELHIKEELPAPPALSPPPTNLPALPNDFPADNHWRPFELACKPDYPPKVRIVTLDLITRLVTHGQLSGNKPLPKMPNLPDNPLLIDVIVDTVCNSIQGHNSSSEEGVQIQAIKCLIALSTSPHCKVHGVTLLKVINFCINVYSFSAKPTNHATAKAAILQILNLVISNLEKYAKSAEGEQGQNQSASINEMGQSDSKASKLGQKEEKKDAVIEHSSSTGHLENDDKGDGFNDEGTGSGEVTTSLSGQSRKDTFLCFRFLCRLSVKEEETMSSVVDMTSPLWRARVFSLEVILFILNNSGPEFHSHQLFVKLIRKSLCTSILKNGVSSDPLMFELCISIFLNLVRYYRKPLKPEIEVIFNQIYLRILDLSNSPTQQKIVVLECIHKVCSNPQLLFDIYLNYDCEISMVSIFERMVHSLSPILQTPLPQKQTKGIPFVMAGLLSDSTGEVHLDDETQIREKALSCLTSIVSSWDSWQTHSHHISPPSVRSVNPVSSRSGSMELKTSDEMAPAQPKEKKSIKEPENLSLSTSEESSRAGPLLVTKNHIGSVWLEENTVASNPASPNMGKTSILTAGVTAANYQEATNRKHLWRQAIIKFNSNSKKGMKLLEEGGFLPHDPLECAKFLISTPDLTKRAIGEYIGEGDNFCIKVMHCFIDSMDFTSTSFVSALRQFLKTFRLPGEAQKIDRIMEKFAHRYCVNNPDMFADADTAYTLAFSIIMLNTDQHSTRVKNKMDEAAFIKNNRGIDNNGDLPNEFLSSIFKDIATNEIVMEEEEIVKSAEVSKTPELLNEKQKQASYELELVRMQKKSQALFQGKRTVNEFKSASDPDLVQPMISVAWASLAAAFRIVFEQSDDIEANFSEEGSHVKSHKVWHCIDSLSKCISMSSKYGLETERDAFLSTLAKLTSLTASQIQIQGQKGSQKLDLKHKNILALQVMLATARSNGEYFDQRNWGHVLRIASQLDRLYFLRVPPKGNESNVKHSPTETEMSPVLDSLFKSQSFVIAIDKIFAQTVHLGVNSVVDFVKALCEVGKQEIEEQLGASPRTYCLAKLVETAYYNLNRIRYEWTQIWRVMQPHFNAAGSHANVSLSTFAIDSLRQLSMKFLEKDELSKYHTQNEYLKPFEYIMTNGKSMDAFELVFNSILQMVSSKGNNIRSGWKTVFIVFGKLAVSIKNNQTDPAINLAIRGFHQAKSIVHDYFKLMIVGDAFTEVVNCFFQYANIAIYKKSLAVVQSESIGMLKYCTVEIAKEWDNNKDDFGLREVKIIEPSLSSALESSNKDDFSMDNNNMQCPSAVSKSNLNVSLSFVSEKEAHFYMSHYPILLALGRLVNEYNSTTVRSEALEILFFIIHQYTHYYTLNCWKSIFKSTIFPIWDELRPNLSESQANPSPAAKATVFPIWIQGMRLLIELFIAKFFQCHPSDVASSETESSPIPIEEGFKLIEPEWLDWFEDTLQILFYMVCYHPSELVSDAGVICFFNQIIEQFGTRIGFNVHGHILYRIPDNVESMTADEWKYQWWLKVTLILENMFKDTLPVELINVKVDESMTNIVSSPNPQVSAGHQRGLAKCRSHLALIQSIWNLVLGTEDNNTVVNAPNSIPQEKTKRISLIELVPYDLIITKWLPSLYSSFEFAKSFNEDYDLRLSLFKQGVVKQMPKLVKQETMSIQTIFVLGYRISQVLLKENQPSSEAKGARSEVDLSKLPFDEFIIENGSIQDKCEHLYEFLIRLAEMVLQDKFIILFSNQHQMYKRQADIEAWGGVLVVIYQEIIATLQQSSNLEAGPTEGESYSSQGKQEGRGRTLLKGHLRMFYDVAVKILGFGFGVDLGPCAGDIIGTEIGRLLCNFVQVISKQFMKL